MDNKEVDVALWFGIIPPALIPLSERAKALTNLPPPATALVILEGPEKALKAFPADYVIGETDTMPDFIATASILVLH